MRVLAFTEGYPPEPGGGSIYAYEIPRRLAKYGVDTLIVTNGSQGPYTDEKDGHVLVMRLNVPHYTKAGFSLSMARLKFVLDAIKVALKMRDEYDVYQFYSGMATNIVAWVLRNVFRLKKPFLMTFLGTFVGQYKLIKPFPIYNIMDFFGTAIMIGPAFDRYIVVDEGSSHGDLFLYRNGVPKDRVKIHYQAVDVERFRPTEKKRGKEMVIGYIGRLDPLKGVDMFIRSLPKVFENVKDVKAVIIGDGPLMGYLKKLTRELQIESKVNFIGAVPHEEMPKYMSMFDCLIFTDIRSFETPDTLSLTHCEAMSCGCLVMTPSAPRKEWNCQTWVKIEKPNPVEISSKVIDVLGNPSKYDEIRKNARKVALKYFDWKNVIGIYERELAKIVEERRQGGR
jgi:glycosyltransferase involved in cell wall biosynthesis